MNVEIPGEVFKAEKRFLEELLQTIECCNLSLIDLSKEDIKHFSVDTSNIFPDVPLNVQIKIGDSEVSLYYGIGLSVKEIYFVNPKAVEAFNDFFNNRQDNDYDERIYFLAKNFSE